MHQICDRERLDYGRKSYLNEQRNEAAAAASIKWSVAYRFNQYFQDKSDALTFDISIEILAKYSRFTHPFHRQEQQKMERKPFEDRIHCPLKIQKRTFS